VNWLPSTKTRYLVLGVSLLAVLAVLDALTTALAGLEALGLALLASACFAVVFGWLLVEPTVHTAMLVGKIEGGADVARVNLAAATVAVGAGLRQAPRVCVYSSEVFNVMTFGVGGGSKIFMSTRAAALPDKELRAIIAHEYGHLLLNHPLARLALFGSLLSLAMLSTGVPAIALSANVFVFWCMRQMEFRADAVAAQLVGAESVCSALDRVQVILGEMPRWQSVFSTHPRFADRISSLLEGGT
jgi:Zn-dependent protease with chaperone function